MKMIENNRQFIDKERTRYKEKKENKIDRKYSSCMAHNLKYMPTHFKQDIKKKLHSKKLIGNCRYFICKEKTRVGRNKKMK